jgi:uncharacterized protein Yka (UPF0111/DUF47 family)
MSEGSNSVIGRVVGRVFPKMPDFFGLLNEQCELAVQASEALVEYMTTSDEAHALRVRELEHLGDELKDRNMDVLNRAFSTPMDREELYRAIVTIDHVINYAKTTVREMEVLGVPPDRATTEIATYLLDGAQALRDGYKLLATDPAAAEGSAQAARKAERNTEKAYRRALAELFDVEAQAAQMDAGGGSASGEALRTVMDVFKKREVYRHMSNGADRVARAGEVLHDIVVKMV